MVCKWVNLARPNYHVDEIKKIISIIKNEAILEPQSKQAGLGIYCTTIHARIRHRQRVTPININNSYLKELWEQQNSLCAITGLPMYHEPNHLYSGSLDRIDNSLG